MPDLSWAEWRKSARSSDDDCVEVASGDGQIAVRDLKDRTGPVLVFTAGAWNAFLPQGPEGFWCFVLILVYAVAGPPVRDFLSTVLDACAEWIASRIRPG